MTGERVREKIIGPIIATATPTKAPAISPSAMLPLHPSTSSPAETPENGEAR